DRRATAPHAGPSRTAEHRRSLGDSDPELRGRAAEVARGGGSPMGSGDAPEPGHRPIPPEPDGSGPRRLRAGPRPPAPDRRPAPRGLDPEQPRQRIPRPDAVRARP